MQTQHVKQSEVRLLSFSGMKCSLRRSLFSGHLLLPSPWLRCALAVCSAAFSLLQAGLHRGWRSENWHAWPEHHSTEQQRGASHRLEAESQKLQEHSKGISGTPALSSVHIKRHMKLKIFKCLIFLMKQKKSNKHWAGTGSLHQFCTPSFIKTGTT